jgi:hypothetical protein
VIGFCPWACHAGFILPCWDLDGCRHALYRDHRQSSYPKYVKRA